VPKIFVRDGVKGSLFVAVNRSLSGLYISRRARLDFDKAEHIFLPAYKVNFSSPKR
jgi:hypothetical protein